MDQDPVQVNRQTYDQIAGQFALRNSEMNASLIQKARRFIATIRPGERILDLGCGPGRDLGWFIHNGINAIGADLSHGMLMEARKVTGARLCQMEMRRLAFASQIFAGVWCNAALLHLPRNEVPKALANIHRVLAPGGHFFMSLQKGSGEGLETAQDGTHTRFFARYEAQEIGRFLEQAGFHVLRQEEYEFRCTWLWLESVRSD